MSDYGTPPPPPPPPEESGQAGGSYPGMQSMPGSAPPPAVEVAQPATIAMAVKLMYVGAALSLLGIIVTLFQRDSIRSAVEKASRTSKPQLTPSQIDTAVGVAVASAVIVGLIGVGLWLWMAWANGNGKKWARTVATVFFGLFVLSTLASLVQHPPALSLVASIVTLVLGGYIIYLLYRPESGEYYQAKSAPKY